MKRGRRTQRGLLLPPALLGSSRKIALVLIVVSLAGSSWLAGGTVRTYLRSVHAFRTLRLEIQAGGRTVVSRVDLTLAVVNGSAVALDVERLELSFYLGDRLVARETVVEGREVLPGMSSRTYPVSFTLRAGGMDLLKSAGGAPRWRAEGFAMVRTNAMRRPVQVRLATR